MSISRAALRAKLNAVKRLLPAPASRGLDLAEFFVVQRLIGFKVPSAPVFDQAGTACFTAALPMARNYLEYGGGGSTVVASKLGIPFLSVDSDPYFVKALVGSLAANDTDKVIYVDIGLTGLWGAPLFETPSEAKRRRWSEYPEAPWRRILAGATRPDLILLDGRFRVACGLTCLKYLNAAPPATILVDDYVGRPDYKVLERFATLEAMHGRMARFTSRPNDLSELERELTAHQLDWR